MSFERLQETSCFASFHGRKIHTRGPTDDRASKHTHRHSTHPHPHRHTTHPFTHTDTPHIHAPPRSTSVRQLLHDRYCAMATAALLLQLQLRWTSNHFIPRIHSAGTASACGTLTSAPERMSQASSCPKLQMSSNKSCGIMFFVNQSLLSGLISQEKRWRHPRKGDARG